MNSSSQDGIFAEATRSRPEINWQGNVQETTTQLNRETNVRQMKCSYQEMNTETSKQEKMKNAERSRMHTAEKPPTGNVCARSWSMFGHKWPKNDRTAMKTIRNSSARYLKNRTEATATLSLPYRQKACLEIQGSPNTRKKEKKRWCPEKLSGKVRTRWNQTFPYMSLLMYFETFLLFCVRLQIPAQRSECRFA